MKPKPTNDIVQTKKKVISKFPGTQNQNSNRKTKLANINLKEKWIPKSQSAELRTTR